MKCTYYKTISSLFLASSLSLHFAILAYAETLEYHKNNSERERVSSDVLDNQMSNLFQKIKRAEKKGIGTKVYISTFQELERAVKNGLSKKKIQDRISRINSALDQQITPISNSIKENFSRKKNVDHKELGLISLQEAREFMLLLINKERKKNNCCALTLNPVATKAAQDHSDEMAILCFASHWNTAGKDAWQRYTEVGGSHKLSENFFVLILNKRSAKNNESFKLDKNQTFSKEYLEQMHKIFMNERPPNDGHRVNILKLQHNQIGIGLSYSIHPSGESRICMAQEFIDNYGEYGKLPNRIQRGVPLKISGTFKKDILFDSIVVYRRKLPSPLNNEQLNNMHPKKNMFEEIICEYSSEVKTWYSANVQKFCLEIIPDKKWKRGLYYVAVYANVPNIEKAVNVSFRTIPLF